MDWTGGARRRFAPKKNNATLQRQKAYFAKARAVLKGPSQHNASRSPTRGYTTSVSQSPQHRSLPHHNNEHSIQSQPRSGMTALGAIGRHTRGLGVSEHRKHPSVNRKYRSSSIISMHSRDRSDLASSSKSELATQQQEARRSALASKDGMDQEERLLLAKRRKLLAQGDWIGLAPVRPVRMQFTSSHDKERIGKRRKIEKSRSKKGEPAGQRLLTPLFEERLQPQQRMMSGALLTDDIQVRVGTDALATQTQESRRSHNSGRTSTRQLSTEFDILSEESMLLGADGDSFDPFQASHITHTPQKPRVPYVQQLCEVANMSRSQYKPESGKQSEAGMRSCSQTGDHQREHRKPDFKAGEQLGNDVRSGHGHLQHPNMAVVRQRSQSLAASDERDNDNAFDREKETNDDGLHQDVLTAVDEDDDDIWRDFMNVAHRMSNNPSVMALKSSSLHMTTSESSHRPVLDRLDKSDEGIDQWISTPNGAGTQDPVVLDHGQATEALIGSGPSEKLPSPSTSLKRITTHATCTISPKAPLQKECDEDEIWREFICGSQEDSESSSQLYFKLSVERRPVGEVTTMVPTSSLHVVSDLGTSNKATIGEDTLVIEESRPGTNAHIRETSSQYQIRPLNGLESVAAQKSASLEDSGDDSIEDDETTNRVEGRSHNMHAPRTTILNPKRFLPPRKGHRPPPKRSSSFLTSREMRN